MATFYLLPPRALLGNRLIAALGIPHALLPACPEMTETLDRAIEATGAFVVHRDDLPLGEEAARALVDGFGAEVGDEIIEVGPDQPPRRWQLPPLAA